MIRRWNLPLLGASILAGALLVLLLLPLIMDVNNPHLSWRWHLIDGVVYRNPLPPGLDPRFILGTDNVGRVFARFVHGARFTLGIALAVTVGRALLAIPIGTWAGWRGGLPARICSSFFGGMSALPALFLMAVILTGLQYLVYKPHDWVMVYIAAMLIVGVPRLAEQVRQQAMQVKVLPFVEGAISVGAPTSIILRRYVLRTISGDLLILLAVEMATILLTMGQLALIGVYPGGTIAVIDEYGRVANRVDFLPEWGQMLGNNLRSIRQAPYMSLYPALGIAVSCVCFHLLAEGLRQRRVRA